MLTTFDPDAFGALIRALRHAPSSACGELVHQVTYAWTNAREAARIAASEGEVGGTSRHADS